MDYAQPFVMGAFLPTNSATNSIHRDADRQDLDDGRLNINLTPHQPWLQRIVPILCIVHPDPEDELPRSGNIVIHVVGSRGDVQPFLGIGKQLKSHGHRDEGLEFFNIGGDPSELMAFMVKNPGLMPDLRTIRSGAIRMRRREMKSILSGCWRSCYETGDGTGIDHHIKDDPDPWSGKGTVDYRRLQFVADVIIANPPSFVHLSCAEKLGVPLNMMFTMPWSATQAFPHPLANVQSQHTKPSVGNFASYAIVEIMMWEGLGDLINRFRKRELGLDPLDAIRAPTARLGDNIDVVGFAILPSAQDYKPPEDLQNFLDAGPAPIYIGFGSIVVDDPKAITNIVFEAVQKAGVCAVISKGWGNIGADHAASDSIIMIDKCPHDWLFQHVSCVVHHGGAGTTAAGLALGKPTIIVPFFGDQTFWGLIVSRAGAGPDPIPWKRLTAEKLAAAIQIALKEGTRKKAEEIGEQMRSEQGARNAVCSFYRHLDAESLRCSLCPHRPAVWWMKQSHIKLSAFAATVLVETGLVKPHDLVLYRSKEYDTSRDPKGPITAGAEVLYGVITDFVAAVATMPTDMAEIFRGNPGKPKWKKEHYGHGKLDTGVGSSSSNQSDERLENFENKHSSAGTDDSDGDLETGSGESSSTYASATEKALQASRINISGGDSKPNTNPHTDSNYDNDIGVTAHQTLSLEETISRQRTGDKSIDTHEFLTDARYHLARAGKHILAWILLLLTDLTLSFSKGFHNAPKLYHDSMVQETPTVRGVRGGLRAVGTEFTQEFYQGVTGLVTQPRHGRKKSGTKGMLKGVGKGAGGAVLKPMAGLWGLAGYPLEGLHKTLRDSLSRSKLQEILASRIQQGLGEMVAATPEERVAVIRRWNEIKGGFFLEESHLPAIQWTLAAYVRMEHELRPTHPPRYAHRQVCSMGQHFLDSLAPRPVLTRVCGPATDGAVE
ncbi:hypothetical protein BDW66DRAFT_169057 [Aspergillus desertorum]